MNYKKRVGKVETPKKKIGRANKTRERERGKKKGPTSMQELFADTANANAECKFVFRG